MKDNLIIIVTIFVLSFIVIETFQYKKYDVTIIFCDSRKPINIIYNGPEAPTNRSINNYRQAVPTWNGHLNVCELISIEIK